MFRFIKKLKIRDKILLSYIPIILAPCILFFIFSNQTVKRHFDNNIVSSAEKSSEQTLDNLDQKMLNLSNAMFTLTSNPIIEEAMNSDFNSMSYYEQYALQCNIEGVFLSIMEQNEITNIKLYMPDGFNFTNMTNTGSFEELKKTEWYNVMLRDKKALLCEKDPEYPNMISIGKLLSPKNNFTTHVGAIKIYVDEKIFKNALQKNVNSTNGLCYITNEHGEIITCSNDSVLEKYRLPNNTLKSLIKSGKWSDISSEYEDKLYSAVYEIDYSGCYLVTILNRNLLREETNNLNKQLILFIIIAMIVSYLFAYFISFSIDKHVIRLNKSIAMTHQGIYKPIALPENSQESNDEIDILTRNYNEMIVMLEDALKTEYENGKIIKNSELKILYEQINPHFLYNVLDLINWMAINNETKNISNTVTMLAKYYKLSLNKGNEILTISDELTHVKLYFDIQKIRFENIEQIIFDVPEEIMSCSILKTVFQPLLENFIVHGIDDETNGIFKIKAEVVNQDIHFTVSDNGTGIEPEIIESITSGTFESKSGSGFGLKSLNERLKIFYGEDYGLTFGDCSNGAVIHFKIPKI